MTNYPSSYPTQKNQVFRPTTAPMKTKNLFRPRAIALRFLRCVLRATWRKFLSLHRIHLHIASATESVLLALWPCVSRRQLLHTSYRPDRSRWSCHTTELKGIRSGTAETQVLALVCTPWLNIKGVSLPPHHMCSDGCAITSHWLDSHYGLFFTACRVVLALTTLTMAM